MSEKVQRLPNLDILRLVAASMVVLFHFGYRGPATLGWTPAAYPELEWIAREMWSGVSFFFIISGFVIAWSAEKRDAFGFAVSRAARLYPAFFAAVLITGLGMLLLAPAHVAEFQVTAARVIASLLIFSKAFGQPFMDGAYWSIVVEIIFYGWVTLFLALGLFHRRQRTLLAGWLAIALINELLLDHGALRHVFVTRHAGWFALGILAYRAFAEARRPSLGELALGVAAVAVCMLDDRNYVGWMQATLGYASAWSPAYSVVKIAVMLALLALAIRLPALASPALCAALGGLTYPLYLLHQNLGYVMMHGLEPMVGRWGAFATSLCAVLALSWLIYRHIEPGGRMFIRSFADSLRRRLSAGPAALAGR